VKLLWSQNPSRCEIAMIGSLPARNASLAARMRHFIQ
jgi:hypothetical protein